MANRKTEMLAPKNVERVARICEFIAQQEGVDTISVYITSGRLFGVGTYGNTYFVDSEDGELHLYLHVEEDD